MVEDRGRRRRRRRRRAPRGRILLWGALTVVVVVLLGTGLWVFIGPGNAPPPGPGKKKHPKGATLTADGGRPFAGSSAWNSAIPKNPRLDRNSRTIAAHLAIGTHANLYEFGTPVYYVDGDAPRNTVPCDAPWGTCDLEKNRVPVPQRARAAPGADGSMVVIDARKRIVYDFWKAYQADSGRWGAAWGTANPLAGTGNEHGGATGGGVSLLTGLVRTFEIKQGYIDHALVFATDISCKGTYRYPATKTDGHSTKPNCLPEGARVQLDPSIDVDKLPGITPGEKAVATALQTYGAYNRDNAGAPMAFGFENPVAKADPYPAAGFTNDYYDMPHIPWNKLRVLRKWNGG